tara:strand:- start:5132 stop:5995 length:864 start_codon:yes stop_codon:yes gene_type:complete
MILVDYSQIAIANIMQSVKQGVNEDIVRHMILNTLRIYRNKFHVEYGELVLCCDYTNNWRKKIFEHYKVPRKVQRKKSNFDWNHFYSILNNIRQELQETFPYKIVHIDHAEADDVIATLVMNRKERLNGVVTEHEPILILSSDKDFIQLQRFENVKQYSPLKKKFLNTDNPKTFLHEHIIKGDTSDGIPNVLSADDTFVVAEKRQKPLSKKKLAVWCELEPKHFCEGEMLRNYQRNEMLIDLAHIPLDLQEQIMDKYYEQPENGRSKLFNYFVKHKLKHLMENISEF